MSGNLVPPKDQRTVGQYFNTTVFAPPALAQQVTDIAGVQRVLAFGNTPATFRPRAAHQQYGFDTVQELQIQREAYSLLPD
jgi:hypothetical protein